MLDNATLWEGLLEKPLGRCAQVSDENGTTNIAQIS
jgi:hypothetical protein